MDMRNDRHSFDCNFKSSRKHLSDTGTAEILERPKFVFPGQVFAAAWVAIQLKLLRRSFLHRSLYEYISYNFVSYSKDSSLSNCLDHQFLRR